jgi:hypothetical protein
MDVAHLDELIQAGSDNGKITNEGIANSLLAKVKSESLQALANGDPRAALSISILGSQIPPKYKWVSGQLGRSFFLLSNVSNFSCRIRFRSAKISSWDLSITRIGFGIKVTTFLLFSFIISVDISLSEYSVSL